jgi:hemerythrin-like domain-containing protein
MKPIGPLMIEHRLIERMVKLLDAELGNIKKTSAVNTSLINAGVDFFHTYADRTHHGKEEEILFRELTQKQLSVEDNELMQRLIQEHIWAREAVSKLSAANGRYIEGDKDALKVMIYEVEKLVKFYPMHIEKEDKQFFIPVMNYFSMEEQSAMLDAFWVFDRNMIHEIYKKVVEENEREMPL